MSISTDPPSVSEGAECCSAPLTDIIGTSPFPDSKRRKSLTRLTLNVTQACNLRCQYCYAEFGRYGMAASHEDLQKYADLLLGVIAHYSRIDTVQFFGGEPLLALDRIKLAVSIFREASAKGLILATPKFMIVTNGTLLTEPSVLSFLKENEFVVTVSCDGPADVTNTLRPDASGARKNADVYSRIRAGVLATRAAGIFPGMEATYTRTHQHMGITVTDMLDNAAAEFGQVSVHVAAAVFSPWGDFRPEPNRAGKEFFHASFVSTQRVCKGEPGVLDSVLSLLGTLASKDRVKGYCPAFTSQLSLDVAGDAYPCFMSMSNREQRLGNILNDQWPTPESAQVYQAYRADMSLGPFGNRHEIWYDSLVSACAAADLLSAKKFGTDADYQVHEAVVAGTLLGLSSQFSAVPN